MDEWVLGASRASLVLLRSPPGFGKTTVMLQLLKRLQEQGKATAWLTLDATDNDLGRFVAGLLGVLQGIDPALDPTAFDRDPFETDSVLLNIQDWLAGDGRPFSLFLDDFEVIHNAEVHAALRQILEDLPPGRLIVVATREAPDLGLGRLRVSGRLLELGLEDLRFAVEETDAFLRQGRALPLDDQDVAQLQRSTEGWAAALQLSALALASADDQKALIRSFSGSHSHIADYLAEEVLSRQSQQVRDFLLKTSVLDRLSGPLCDAVLGGTEGYRMLSFLERANLFLVPLDEQRRWYRYHHVFQDFLRGRLDREFPGALGALHRAAADWFAQQGDAEEAAKHAFAAGDLDRAADLVAHYAADLVRAGRVGTVEEWVDRLPPGTLDRYPRLRLALCWALGLRNRYQEAGALLDQIRLGVERRGSADSEILDEILCLQVLTNAERGEECLRLARAALPRVSDRDSFAFGILLNVMACRLLEAGQFDEAQRTLDAARNNHLHTGSLLGLTYVECIMGALRLTQGNLRDALDRYRSAFSRVRSAVPGYSMPGVVAAAFLAEALYEADEIDEAEQVLNAFRELFPRSIPLDVMLLGYITRARIYMARGQPDKGARLCVRAERIGEEHHAPRVVATIRLELVRGALQRGDVAEALRFWQAFAERGAGDAFVRWSMPANDPETPQIGELRLSIRQGQARKAVARLRSELDDAEQSGRRRRALKLRILLAEALSVAGDRALALRTLREAALFGSREGFIRSFADEGANVIALVRELREAADAGDGTGRDFVNYLGRILSAASPPGEGAHAPTPSQEAWPFEALTDRELEVLELAAAGRSNRALADQLFVSVQTIKYHLRNINLKLDSANRTEAVAKARRLGLIP